MFAVVLMPAGVRDDAAVAVLAELIEEGEYDMFRISEKLEELGLKTI